MSSSASTDTRRSRRAGASDRMPVPTRQRRPGLAALAIVLILGGAALSGYLALFSNKKHSVVFARTQITVGQKITRDDLAEGQISATFDRSVDFEPVYYADIQSLVGEYATSTIPNGALVTTNMANKKAPNASCTEVAFSVVEGSYAPGIEPGDLVKIVSVPGSNDQQGGINPKDTHVVASKAYVTNIKGSSTGRGGGAVITVLAKNTPDGDTQTDAGDLRLAVANAQQGIQVLRLPGDTSQPSFLAACK